ncbi:hypothetical protein AAFN85_31695 [Mucilaginibacter sp. CAU 1740]|uniref:hypothetical protein n=1 Tax=Mucilaginibacter sp. CAU 1740 TaxID=3140365 RepID=UPI00325A4B2A
MPIGNYTLDEIYVGDEVAFESPHVDTDHYWIVTGKDINNNSITIKTAPQAIMHDTWTLQVKEIRVVLPISKERNSSSI